ncbi:unnamed protein product [Rangifer tarandus platyrhynchus]|uniref:Uncharacterized protein n=1 Tax=Rangifer tarandus platyrhynchus TaxID=3082113 RepID=A0ABN8ZFM3_RANTA|nr:unnamed protein product [Rangifer tarandus platyrhynchus]
MSSPRDPVLTREQGWPVAPKQMPSVPRLHPGQAQPLPSPPAPAVQVPLGQSLDLVLLLTIRAIHPKSGFATPQSVASYPQGVSEESQRVTSKTNPSHSARFGVFCFLFSGHLSWLGGKERGARKSSRFKGCRGFRGDLVNLRKCVPMFTFQERQDFPNHMRVPAFGE